MNPYFEKIDQPALVLNEEQAKANIHFMAQKAKDAHVTFRPHFKTHQSASIGEWFQDEGVRQITVSSVAMAEYFADHGWQDITIAFSVNPRQIDRMKDLAGRVNLSLLVESVEGVQALKGLAPAHAAVWIKIDVGAHRTGMDWQNMDEIVHVCDAIATLEHLSLSGLLTHSGHTYSGRSTDEIVHLFREGVDRLNMIRAELTGRGHPGLLVSVGDTPGCTLCDDFSGVDEIRPGNFVFYDVHQLLLGVCTPRQIAVAAACPVIAFHPEREEMVIYGGAVHLSKDLNVVNGVFNYGLVALPEGFGWGDPIPGAFVKSLSQEHGIIHIPASAFMQRPLHAGDLLCVLPAHSCLTVQELGEYITLEGKRIPTMLIK